MLRRRKVLFRSWMAPISPVHRADPRRPRAPETSFVPPAPSVRCLQTVTARSVLLLLTKAVILRSGQSVVRAWTPIVACVASPWLLLLHGHNNLQCCGGSSSSVITMPNTASCNHVHVLNLSFAPLRIKVIRVPAAQINILTMFETGTAHNGCVGVLTETLFPEEAVRRSPYIDCTVFIYC
jgi:hypothetical protein